jgi:hypothetical protein
VNLTGNRTPREDNGRADAVRFSASYRFVQVLQESGI